MRATTIKCPECGATVNVPAGVEVATCEYCGASAQIQRRSPILQRPVPLRMSQPGAPELPVATSTKAIGAIGCSVILLGILAGIVVPIVFAVRGCKEEAARKSAFSEPRWDGISRPVVRDLTGDGVQDIIGRVRILKPNDEILMAAFDGASGKRLWVSESLGDRSEAAFGPMALADDMVLVSDGSAGLIAMRAGDGDITWQIRLNEVVDKICAGTAEGTVLVRTKDEKLHPVSVADGSLQSAEDDAQCLPLPNDSAREDLPDCITYRWSNPYRQLVVDDKIEGMDSNTSLHYVPGDVTIALGNKEPGTEVPMIASYRWPQQAAEELDLRAIRDQMAAAKDPEQKRALYALYRKAREQERIRGKMAPEVLWTAVVPGVDPLSVATGAPNAEQVALNQNAVVIAYETRETHHFRLTAFSVADGKRKWDIELPGDRPLSSVAVSASHAMVSRWDGLSVYDLATGEHAYTID